MIRRLALVLILAAGSATAAPLDILVEEQAREEFGATLPEQGTFNVTLSTAPVEEAMVVSAYWMDPATGQFVANVLTEAGVQHRIAGFAIYTVPVPVPARRLMSGEVISESDLGSIDMPLSRIGSFAIADAAGLIGMEVKSLLAQGRPIMAQSVQQPLVIARGQEVSIRYDDGRLALTAPGRALRDAHKGQEIKVVNLSSNATVTGTASGDGTVEVRR
ncbi:flagellar basal-body P-ring formation protein FlgA [Roseivivax halodurans JCM 10272]|uniref:Flagella basal body P-ring formation protein FlgA n=1 Tax=Roseivivax halodurans JCM 10272 TaxID=1449350 RepID=X7EJN8_9RHOB|nr:flagellar basal body P-ring formation chaperone FlgA [Roseivivax halodurans]ETX16319.1 flagellar basal-body P-ring formation protein FlgA [Roseivivax halodurans JCM 10272]